MSFYANKTARFDGTARALTEDELRTLAPSVFAVTAHESRSDRFRPIPTIEIIRGLANEGFQVVGAQQCVARMPGKQPYTKHLLRIRQLGDDTAVAVGGVVSEMLMKNANDGSAMFDLMTGLFRVMCQNSLVTPVSTLESVKVRHSGDVMSKVIEGTYRVVQESKKALAAPEVWSGIQLDADERAVFAEAAHLIRFADHEGNVHTPIKPHQLMAARREEDTGRDLWTTFNVAQENMIRGGLTGIARTEDHRTRRSTTRGINGIDQSVKLNKALWLLADRMAELKGAERLAA